MDSKLLYQIATGQRTAPQQADGIYSVSFNPRDVDLVSIVSSCLDFFFIPSSFIRNAKYEMKFQELQGIKHSKTHKIVSYAGASVIEAARLYLYVAPILNSISNSL